MDITLRLNNQVEMPALGFGVFQTPPDETAVAVETALGTGYRHIDTAAAYGNERGVGEGLRRSGVDRSDVFVETKVWISDYGYDATRHVFDKSVGKLGVEQLDLLILHQPLPTRFDLTAEAYRALESLLAAANDELGILTQAWSPIGGITFYREGGGSTLEDPVIGGIAAAHGRSPAQVMLRWHLQQGRSAIPKSTRPERIAENFDVVDVELTDEELNAIDALDRGVRRGPEPASLTLEEFGRPIPEA